jgi:hypothetical protein
MKQMKLGCSLSLLLLTSLVQAQHSLAVPVSLEHAIKERAPEWNLIFVSIRKSKEENNTHFRWKHEDQEVGVFVNEYESIERITPNSLLTQAFRKQEKIKGIGDEAYLLGPASYGARRVNVIFRKGKVHVDVEAPSIDVAQLFAKHLADALPAVKE